MLVDRDSGIALAVVDGNFLIASNRKAMKTVLENRSQHAPCVFDHPTNKKYLRKLPAKRDGTLVLNNTVYAEHALQNRQYMPAPVLQKMERFATILPVTLASLSVEENTAEENTEEKDTEGNAYLHVQSVTPLVLKGFDNKDFRKDLRAIYSQSIAFKTPNTMPQDTSFLLAWAGVDRFYDFYTKHLTTPEEKTVLRFTNDFLKSKDMDLRKDVVGLLEGEAALMLRKKSKKPLLLFTKTGEKEKKLTRLTGLLSMAPVPIEQKKEQFGNTSATTLVVPGKDLRISFGSVGPIMGFGITPHFADLVKVKERDMKSLAQDSTYQHMTRRLPRKANGLFYVRFKPSPNNPPSRWIRMASGAVWARKEGDADIVFGKFTLKLVNDPEAKS